MKSTHAKLILVLVAVALIVLSSDRALQAKEEAVCAPASMEVTYLSPGPRPEAQHELEVWGIGDGRKEQEKVTNALLDAKRAACWFELAPPEGILITSELRSAFDGLACSFFDADTISQFIVSMSDIKEKNKIGKKGEKVKVRVNIVVDFRRIEVWLKDRGLVLELRSRAFIMFLPWVPKGGNPLQALQTDKLNRDIATALMNHFSPDRFEVKMPEAELNIQDIIKATELIEDHPDDYAYRIALASGSDIYLTYEYRVEPATQAGQDLIKATLLLNAYETTTAKNLGSQTGYSDTYPASYGEMKLLEEASALAMFDIIRRFQKYMFDINENGAPFRLVYSITEDAEENDVMDIQDCFIDCIDEIKMADNENILSSSKIDYVVWADLAKYEKGSKLERALRKCVEDACGEWKITGRRVNKKLIQAEIVAAE